jgi:hypothetical protein
MTTVVVALIATILAGTVGVVFGCMLAARSRHDVEAAAHRNRNIAWQLGSLSVALGADRATVDRLLAGLADPAEEIDDVTKTVQIPLAPARGPVR